MMTKLKDLFVIGHFLIFAVIILSVSNNLSATEEEDEDIYIGSAQIESKTKLNSAKCVIEGSDQKTDRERKVLGAGEEVDLTLWGKPALIGEDSSIEWSLDENSKKYAKLIKNITNKRKVQLNIEKHLSVASAIVKVKVRTEVLEQPLSVEYTIYRPQANFKVENMKTPLDNFPANGDTKNFGASTKLELTVMPITVSFANIRITELNEDEGPPNPQPTLYTYHNPGIGTKPDERNVVPDHIGAGSFPIETVRGNNPVHPLPQNFTWKSSWIVNEAFDQEPFEIQKSSQVFNFLPITGPNGNREVRTTITKFGQSVSRTTLPGNTQEY